MKDIIKLCGLWRHETSDKSPFYTGKLSYSASLLIFKNKFKDKDTDPDLIAYIGKVEKRPAMDRGEPREPEPGDFAF